ncbi:MAG: hypothetical protein ACT4PV_01565 [Planctomycetaceae bacterium]
MSVVFGCPGCGKGMEGAAGAAARCLRCGAEAHLAPDPAPDPLVSCLACGGELYKHRDFNQKLGLALVALGAGLWIALGSFWPMVAAAAVDLLLFLTLPDVAICYRCQAHHRAFPRVDRIASFDLERHEHFRFLKAREEGRISPRGDA